MSRSKRILYWTIATWPQQIALAYMAGLALSVLLINVLNGALWVAFVASGALGIALSRAIPTPREVRKRLAPATLAERNTP